MRILPTFILSTFLLSGVIAQDKFGVGYYVTNTLDTVHGYIQYRANYNNGFKFASNLKAPTQRLTIDQVKSFGFTSGTTYARVEYHAKESIPSKPIFIRPIVQGEVDLFYHKGKLFIGSEKRGRFALAKKSANNAEAMKNYQKNTGTFNILFQDCPSVKDKAQTIHVGEENLVDLLRAYHTCRGLEYKEFKTKKSKVIAQVGIFVGQNFSTLTFAKPQDFVESDYLYNSTFETSSLPTFGITTVIGRRTSMLSFQGALAYTKANFNATWTYSDADFGGYDISQTSVTSVKYNSICLSAGLRISLRSNKLNPYLSFGLARPKFFSIEESVNQISTVNSSVKEENFKIGITPPSFAVWGAAGIKKKIGKRNALFAECNYENSYASVESDNVAQSARISGTAFRVGFLF